MGDSTVQSATDLTRVLIVHDDPLVRGVLRTTCEASHDLCVVGDSHCDGAAVASLQSRPDIVVLEPGDAWATEDLVERIRSGGADAPRVLVVGDPPEGRSALRWLRMPIDGLIPASSGVGAVADAIRSIAAGARVVDAHPRALAIAELGRDLRAVRAAGELPLTATEVRLLALLADGLTIRQAASRMGVSPRTVESRVTRVYRKLGARSRVQALARASAAGHVDLGPRSARQPIDEAAAPSAWR
jgi:DNA-binding NarL/FixJ family response regulator